MELLVPVILGVLVLGTFVVHLLVLASAFRAAGTLFHQVVNVYAAPHEYRAVEASELPHVPLDGYERASAELSKLGFRPVGRMENLTLSKAYPSGRTFLDVYLAESGWVYAATYRVLDPKVGQQILDFETAFEDGSFLITTNSRFAGTLHSPPEIEMRILCDVEDVGTLLQAHVDRLDQLRSSSGKQPQRVQSLAEIEREQYLFSDLVSKYRKSVGYLTFDEVRAMADEPGLMAKGRSFLPGTLRFLYWVFGRYVHKHQQR